MLKDLLQSKRVLICVGTGGVGKTTTSAVLGLLAAHAGRRTVVLTVDPAKRLATALDTELSDTPRDLTEAVQKFLPEVRSFSAVVPDTRKTFMALVQALAPTPALAERMIANPIFETLTRDFSGANEYMALHRLSMLAQDAQWETIVLDTPPSKNVAALLRAPELLGKLFEEKLLKLLATQSRILAAGVDKALQLLEHLTGAGFVRNLHDFVITLNGMRDRFIGSVEHLSQLLKSDEVAYVGIAAPTTSSLQELAELEKALKEHGRPLAGMILNRCVSGFKFEGAVPTGFQRPAAWLSELQKRESALEARIRSKVILKLPELSSDIQGLCELCELASFVDATGP